MTVVRNLQVLSLIIALLLSLACHRENNQQETVDESWKPRLLSPSFDPIKDGFPPKYLDRYTDQHSTFQLIFTGSPDILQLSFAPHPQDSFSVLLDVLSETKVERGKKLFASIAVENPGKDKDKRGHVVTSYYVYDESGKLIASAKLATVWLGSGLPDDHWQFASQPLVFQIPQDQVSHSYTILADIYDVKNNSFQSLSKSISLE